MVGTYTVDVIIADGHSPDNKEVSMSTEQNLPLVRRFLDGINSHNLDVLDEICAPSYIAHFPGSPGPLTRETVKPVWEQFFAAFPDLTHTLEDMFADGDRVVVRMRIAGKHTGEFMGMPPTNRAITIGSINCLHCADGQIVEQWIDYDGLGMLQQLGAVPMPQPATV
jgi:predicted ester cyclase